MYWVLLYIAIFFEVAATTLTKLSDGFKNFTISFFMILFYAISLIAFNYALNKIDVGLAYAIWSGIGTIAITIVGVAMFKEPIGPAKIIAISLIILGVLFLNIKCTH
jgi:small multidrug resistance pump